MKVLTDEKIGTPTPKYNAKNILVFFSNCLDQSLDPNILLKIEETSYIRGKLSSIN